MDYHKQVVYGLTEGGKDASRDEDDVRQYQLHD